MEEPIIQLKGLTKQYGDLVAVDHLDLTVYKGEIFGLLGPNGAGKSTTILMMLGLTEPTEGQAWIGGINATRNPLAVKRRVGYLPDDVGFYSNRTGRENLVYTAQLNGITEKEAYTRADKLLRRVGMAGAAEKKTGAYSRGMRQRLGLADVLMKEPEIIILDEPTLGIDPEGVRDFLQLIVQLSRQEGLTVLLSSHHLHQVQQVCDRVGIFVAGRLLAEGDIPSLSHTLFDQAPFQIEIGLATGDIRALGKMEIEEALRDHPAIRTCTWQKEDTLLLECTEDVAAAVVKIAVEREYGVISLQRKEPGLDEIYHCYFEKNKSYAEIV